MSLATRCPYCHTTFRVTHDQLKLRGGLVRCGACKEIFNGVEHLLPPMPLAGEAGQAPAVSVPPPNAAPATQPAMPAAPTSIPAPTAPAATEEPAPQPPGLPATPSAAPDTEAATAGATGEPAPPIPTPDSTLPPPTAEQDLDPLTRMTLMDMRPWPGQAEQDRGPTDAGMTGSSTADAMAGLAPVPASGPASGEDEVGRALDELQSKPWRGSVGPGEPGDEIDALDSEEPEFVRQARLQQQRGRRIRLALASGSILLFLLAILQGLLLMRTAIAAQWPATVPALTQLCNVFGCKLGMPAQIEYVTIESSELQALATAENSFQLSTLLRNRSSVMQAWPWLELTLIDTNEQPVARRVLAPSDYLGTQDKSRGLAASSERPIRVTLLLSQLKASGYRLYVFYP